LDANRLQKRKAEINESWKKTKKRKQQLVKDIGKVFLALISPPSSPLWPT